MLKIKLLVLPILASIGLSALTGCERKPEVQTKEEILIIDNDEKIVVKNMTVKMLSSGTDANNHPYKTYSYSISPADAAYTDIDIYVTFADNRNNGSDYLTATVDSNAQTFTITCLAAFDSVATVRLQARVGGAYAEITVNYRQKLEGVGGNILPQEYTVELNRSFQTYEEDVNKIVNFKELCANALTLNKTTVYTLPLSGSPVIDRFTDGNGADAGDQLKFIELEDYPNATSGSTPTSSEGPDYANWFLHEVVYGSGGRQGFFDVDMNDTASYGANPFLVIKNAWDNADDTHKGYMRRCLNDDGTWHFVLNRTPQCTVIDPLGNSHAFISTGVIHIHLRPYTSWGIEKTYISSITPESPSIEF